MGGDLGYMNPSRLASAGAWSVEEQQVRVGAWAPCGAFAWSWRCCTLLGVCVPVGEAGILEVAHGGLVTPGKHRAVFREASPLSESVVLGRARGVGEGHCPVSLL